MCVYMRSVEVMLNMSDRQGNIQYDWEKTTWVISKLLTFNHNHRARFTRIVIVCRAIIVIKGSNMIVCVLLVSNSRGSCLAAPGDHEGCALCSTARISRGRFPVETGRFLSKQGVSTTTKHSPSCYNTQHTTNNYVQFINTIQPWSQ